MLASNIIVAEILATSPYLFSYPNMPTKEQYLAYQKRLQFISFPDIEQQIVAAATWPNYTSSDNYIGNLANDTNTTILFLNGNMDTQTPFEYAQYAFGFYTNKTSKRLIEFNGYGHAILNYDCGMQIILSFLQSKGNLKTINTTCTQKLAIRFYANSSLAKNSSKYVFGTDNVWGDRNVPIDSSSKYIPPADTHVNLYIIIGVASGFLLLGIIFFIVKRKVKSEEHEEKSLLNSDSP